MNWIGKWKNQYGSVLEISKQENGKVEGIFESAVDERTKGEKLFCVGTCNDSLIAVSCAGGDHIVTYAGMFYQGKMETAWQVVSSKVITAKNEGEPAVKKPLSWWQSVKMNVDTFERM